MPNRWMSMIALVLVPVLGMQGQVQKTPPWSKGANDPATNKGYEFQVPDIDNVPDLHGNPADAELVLLIGGNQFFVLPQLIAGFEAQHPELKGKIFYETLPPGILRKQIDAGGVITLGNLTVSVTPDVYEAGAPELHTMQTQGQIKNVVEYATNDLAIMVPASNPKHVASLNDLGHADLRLSMPNPAWEGIAKQIAEMLRQAGGDDLYQAVYQKKVKDGSSVLTEIHHRQTPMRILDGKADAGVVWASEVRFQEQIGNPITGVPIPEAQNMTAIYAAGMLTDAPHADAARQWLTYLASAPAQAVYHEFGFKPLEKRGK
jgi:ABC-type molybdate transport system substrate-binding protein